MLSLKGSVGHGQELPGGACHSERHMDALAQAGAGSQHLPLSPPSDPGAGNTRRKPLSQATVREGRERSLQFHGRDLSELLAKGGCVQIRVWAPPSPSS